MILIVALIPIVACIAGLLTYALSANAKVVELGRLTFFAGLFVALLVAATHVVRVAL